jgi:hypothetical protein
VSRLAIQNLDWPIPFATEAFTKPRPAIQNSRGPIQISESPVPVAGDLPATGSELAEWSLDVERNFEVSRNVVRSYAAVGECVPGSPPTPLLNNHSDLRARHHDAL